MPNLALDLGSENWPAPLSLDDWKLSGAGQGVLNGQNISEDLQVSLSLLIVKTETVTLYWGYLDSVFTEAWVCPQSETDRPVATEKGRVPHLEQITTVPSQWKREEMTQSKSGEIITEGKYYVIILFVRS